MSSQKIYGAVATARWTLAVSTLAWFEPWVLNVFHCSMKDIY